MTNFLADEPARKEGETPAVRCDLYGTSVERLGLRPMYSLSILPYGQVCG